MALNKLFSALADENRQKILELLKREEMNVSEILEHLNITMATLSHHLDILKRNELISSRKNGQQVIYSINLSVFEEVSEKIIKFLTINKKTKS